MDIFYTCQKSCIYPHGNEAKVPKKKKTIRNSFEENPSDIAKYFTQRYNLHL